MPNEVYSKVLVSLRNRLYNAGINMHIDTCLSVLEILEINNINSEEKLIGIQYKLRPIIVKSTEEQKLFDTVMNDLAGEYKYLTLDISETANTEKQKSDKKKKNFYKRLKRIKRRDWITGFAILALLSFYIVLSQKESSELSPEVVQDLSDTNSIKQDKKGLIKGTEKVNRCEISPNFIQEIDTSQKLSFIFYNTTPRPIGCIKIFTWDFGDGIFLKQSKSDTARVIHKYTYAGTYLVSLTCNTTNGSVYKYSKKIIALTNRNTLGFDINPSPAPLLILNKSFLLPVKVIVSLGVTVIILLIFYFSNHLSRKQKLQDLKAFFSFSAKRKSKQYFEFGSNENLIKFENNAQNYFNEFYKKSIEFLDKINVKKTISETISNIGFPSIRYKSKADEYSFIFFIDLGNGVNQRNSLFDILVKKVLPDNFPHIKFYYRTNLDFLSRDKNMQKNITLKEIMSKYSKAKLVIFGDGQSILDQYHTPIVSRNNNFKSNIHRRENKTSLLISQFATKILITPVPRNNWSTNERTLLRSISIFPMTESGFKNGVATLFKSAKVFPKANSDLVQYLPYPLENAIESYKLYFGQRSKLLLWLYSLSISDRQELSLTLAVGESLDRFYFNDIGKSIITYSNLLDLTSVEWMQSGIISTSHRSEMLEELRKFPDGEFIIKVAASALLNFYGKIFVEENTLLSLQKKITEAILLQWANKENLDMVGFLYNENLVDKFNATQLSKHIKKFNRSFFLNSYKWLIPLMILIFGLSFFAMNRYPYVIQFIEEHVPNKTDSFAYYNNLACNAMQNIKHKLYTSKDTTQLVNANILLNKASVFNDTSSILYNNRLILSFKNAKLLFESDNYKGALDTFNNILAMNTGKRPLREDSIQIFSLLGKANSLYYLGELDYFSKIFTYLYSVDVRLENFDSLTQNIMKERLALALFRRN